MGCEWQSHSVCQHHSCAIFLNMREQAACLSITPGSCDIFNNGSFNVEALHRFDLNRPHDAFCMCISFLLMIRGTWTAMNLLGFMVVFDIALTRCLSTKMQGILSRLVNISWKYKCTNLFKKVKRNRKEKSKAAIVLVLHFKYKCG